MALEPQLESATELFERLKSCMQAEELIQKTFIRINGGKQITLNEWMKAKFDIQSEIRLEIHKLHLPENKSQALYSHLDLSFLTDHTITRPQFEAIFNICPDHNIDYFMLEYVWKHNTQCLLFFIKGYAKIVQELQVAIDADIYYGDYFDTALSLHYQLSTLYDGRKFFPFCNNCPQNLEKQCSLWADVLSQIKASVSGSWTKESAVSLRRYFEGLDITCMIPKTVDELKQRSEI